VQLKIIVEKGFYGKVRTIREREGGGGCSATKGSITQRLRHKT